MIERKHSPWLTKSEQLSNQHDSSDVNVPEGEMVQFTTALGAAVLGHRRLKKLEEEGTVVARAGGSTFVQA